MGFPHNIFLLLILAKIKRKVDNSVRLARQILKQKHFGPGFRFLQELRLLPGLLM